MYSVASFKMFLISLGLIILKSIKGDLYWLASYHELIQPLISSFARYSHRTWCKTNFCIKEVVMAGPGSSNTLTHKTIFE